MSYCSGYIVFFSYDFLMFMDVGDTHDEAIFGSLLFTSIRIIFT